MDQTPRRSRSPRSTSPVRSTEIPEIKEFVEENDVIVVNGTYYRVTGTGTRIIRGSGKIGSITLVKIGENWYEDKPWTEDQRQSVYIRNIGPISITVEDIRQGLIDQLTTIEQSDTPLRLFVPSRYGEVVAEDTDETDTMLEIVYPVMFRAKSRAGAIIAFLDWKERTIRETGIWRYKIEPLHFVYLYPTKWPKIFEELYGDMLQEIAAEEIVDFPVPSNTKSAVKL